MKYVLHHAKVLHLVASMNQCQWGIFFRGLPIAQVLIPFVFAFVIVFDTTLHNQHIVHWGWLFCGGYPSPIGQALNPWNCAGSIDPVPTQSHTWTGERCACPEREQFRCAYYACYAYYAGYAFYAYFALHTKMLAKRCMQPQQGCIRCEKLSRPSQRRDNLYQKYY